MVPTPKKPSPQTDSNHPQVHPPKVPKKNPPVHPANEDNADGFAFQPSRERREYQRGNEDIIPNIIEQTDPEKRGLV